MYHPERFSINWPHSDQGVYIYIYRVIRDQWRRGREILNPRGDHFSPAVKQSNNNHYQPEHTEKLSQLGTSLQALVWWNNLGVSGYKLLRNECQIICSSLYFSIWLSSNLTRGENMWIWSAVTWRSYSTQKICQPVSSGLLVQTKSSNLQGC